MCTRVDIFAKTKLFLSSNCESYYFYNIVLGSIIKAIVYWEWFMFVGRGIDLEKQK